MTTAIDTNILARALLNDDAKQSPIAQRFLREVGDISLSIVVVAELVWVMRTKGVPIADIVTALETLSASGKLQTDRPRFDAGVAFMARGGDFADGVALHDAVRSGATPIRTFDRKFARLGAPDVTLIS